MILETSCVGSLETNCYIIAEERHSQAIIIDPGEEEQKIRRSLRNNGLKPAFIINTHGHIDHIGCNDDFAVPVYIHYLDLAMLRDPRLNLSNMLQANHIFKSEARPLHDKDTVKLGSIELEVIHTPGHTQGSICLLVKKPESNILFSGDTLFCNSVGRADLPGSDEAQLIKSIKDRLLVLPDETIVYPGHGEPSTIGEERENNPFLR